MYKYVISLLVGLCGFVVFGASVLADSYSVSAAVPYPVPSVAASTDSSLQGATLSTPTFDVFGTCQAVSPYTVVSIMQGSQVLATTTCASNGTFRVNVGLLEGVNQLLVRSSNITANYGPDSQVLQITYAPAPATSVPQPQQTNANSAPSAASDRLSINTVNAFEVLNVAGEVKIEVVVGGGSSPYRVEIVWGDGSVDNKTFEKAGTYSFTHKYLTNAAFQAIARVTDVLGATKEHFFAILSPKSPAQTTQDTGKEAGSSGAGRTISWRRWLLIFAQSVALTSVFIVGWWLGARGNVSLKDEHIKHPRRHIKKRVLIWLLIFALLFSLLASLYWVFGSGTSSAVITTDDTSVNQVKGETQQLSQVQTPYFATRIPTQYVQKRVSETPNAPILAQYLYAETKKLDSAQIGVTIGVLEQPDFESISLVRQRRNDPAAYSETQMGQVVGTDTLSFVSSDKSEVAVFFMAGDRYAAVVVSGSGDSLATYKEVARGMLASWQWL